MYIDIESLKNSNAFFLKVWMNSSSSTLDCENKIVFKLGLKSIHFQCLKNYFSWLHAKFSTSLAWQFTHDFCAFMFLAMQCKLSCLSWVITKNHICGRINIWPCCNECICISGVISFIFSGLRVCKLQPHCLWPCKSFLWNGSKLPFWDTSCFRL